MKKSVQNYLMQGSRLNSNGFRTNPNEWRYSEQKRRETSRIFGKRKRKWNI
jgi:hypothetical protein